MDSWGQLELDQDNENTDQESIVICAQKNHINY